MGCELFFPFMKGKLIARWIVKESEKFIVEWRECYFPNTPPHSQAEFFYSIIVNDAVAFKGNQSNPVSKHEPKTLIL